MILEKLNQSKNFYFVAGFHGSRFCQAKINLRATGFMYLALRGNNLKLVKNTEIVINAENENHLIVILKQSKL